MGMSEGSLADWISEMGRPKSGRFRVAVNPKNGKLFAIESTQIGSPEFPAWHSISNHPAANLGDAFALRGTDPSTWHANKHKVLLGLETGANGLTYPRFNPGSRMEGTRFPIQTWRNGDAINPRA